MFSLGILPQLVLVAAIGLGIGYFIRQQIAQRRAGSLEARLAKMVEKAKAEVKEKEDEAKGKAREIINEAKEETARRQSQLTKIEDLLLKREEGLEKKIQETERKIEVLEGERVQVSKTKEVVEEIRKKEILELERISNLNQEKAKAELFNQLEKTYSEDLLRQIHRLQNENRTELDKKTQDILVSSLQRYAGSVVSEVTTTYVKLPSEELKGKIIGKEGRNIKALERLTGVEIVVDETPDSVMISGFDPVRRQIAKTALEDLIKDGRIQPAKIEEAVATAREKVNEKAKEAGEAAVFDLGLTGIDPRLIQLLGRLKFRTSFGQNVLDHSVEASHIAGMLAVELGVNVRVAKMGTLFHDVGKAIDHEVQGSHVDIGRRILQKFGVDENVVKAMQAHHGEYPYETPESIIVQVAESISAARPGARKDSVEIYLKRLEDIERITNSFEGIEKSYAIQSGREVRVFVMPDKIDDFGMHKLAKDMAAKIQEELRYPGEIKITVIRENRAVEYAK
ncbi:MAG: ribonuclease Y [Patescibacteria group bacterium]